jgi:two-component system response regulator YesN
LSILKPEFFDSGNGGQAIDVAQETEDDLIRLLRVRAMSAFDRAFEKLLCALRDERVPRETAYAVMLNVYARIRRLLDSASADDKESTGRLARTLWRTRRQEDTIRVFGDAVMLIVDQVRRDSSCSDERVADRAREVVREQFTDPSLSVAMIAESLGLSPNYLSSLYKKATDTNMTDYIAEVRLNAAADALSNSDALVYEIAERVGYSSPYHFSTRFKRRFGLAPLQYRKLHSFR